jgi:hypothetical protein
MQSIQELLLRAEIKKKPRSERADLIGQVFEFYKLDNKRNNWRNYIQWLKINKFKPSKLKVEEFKKTKLYFKEKTIKTFCFNLAHIPTKSLYYVCSQGRDKRNRGENFCSWLFSQIKAK